MNFGQVTLEERFEADTQRAIDLSLIENYRDKSLSERQVQKKNITQLVNQILAADGKPLGLSFHKRCIFDINYFYNEIHPRYLYKEIHQQVDWYKISFIGLTILSGLPLSEALIQSVMIAFSVAITQITFKKFLEKCPSLPFDPNLPTLKFLSFQTAIKVSYIAFSLLFKAAYHAAWCVQIYSLASLDFDYFILTSLLSSWRAHTLYNDFSEIKKSLRVLSAERVLPSIDNPVSDELMEKLESERENSPNDGVLEICGIKLQTIIYPIKASCGHLFEASFIIRQFVLKGNCPICRADITNTGLSFDHEHFKKIKERIEIIKSGTTRY